MSAAPEVAYGASPAACEVYAIGLLPDFHRLLHVKTLDAASPDEGYARTRAFYLLQGFLPLQTLPANPCLFLARPL